MAAARSLSVLWSDSGGAPRAGRLELLPGAVSLAGGSRLHPELHEIPLAEIAEIRIGRHVSERLSGRAALLLALRDGRQIAIASLSGVGTLRELAERLWALTGPPPEPDAR
jgi:hypothetical protein